MDSSNVTTIAGQHQPTLPKLPLDSLSFHIRLLELKAGEPDDTPSCSLSVYPLDASQRPAYSALSYHWGDDAAEYEIYIDGVASKVRPNLYGALKCLQQTEYNTLWIDAICIDQTNVQERNNQVRQMGETYKAADRTIVWLASHGFDIDFAAVKHLIARLLTAYRTFRDVFSKAGSYILHGKALDEVGLPTWRRHREPELDILHRFFTLPWFNRAWVVQEVAFAREILCCSPAFVLSWDDIGEVFVEVLEKIDGWLAFVSLDFQRVHRIHYIGLVGFRVTQAVNGQDGDIANEIFQNCTECKDPRDKVFSQMAMYQQILNQRGQLSHVEINYAADVSIIYRQLTEDFLGFSPNIDILGTLRYPDQISIPHLPSWCRNWATTSTMVPLDALSRNSDWRATDFSVKRFLVSGRALRLTCQVVDEITAISMPAFIGIREEVSQPVLPPSLAIKIGTFLRSRLDFCCIASGQQAARVDPSEVSRVFSQTVRQHRNPSISEGHGVLEMISLACFYIDLCEAVQLAGEGFEVIDPAFCKPFAPPMYTDDDLEWALNPSTALGTFAMDDPLAVASTKNRSFANVPYHTSVGDKVILCAGGNFPFIARPKPNGEPGRWSLIGGCYVDGIMHGEAWKPEEAEDIWFQ